MLTQVGRRRARQLLLVAVFMTCSLALQQAQDVAPDTKTAPAASTMPVQNTPTFTLHVTAREVVLDVIARDKKYRPLGDLKDSDFQIFEVLSNKERRQRRLSAFQLIDPAQKSFSPIEATGGFHIALTGGCAARITVHYRLSFQPSEDGWKGGSHELLVMTKRPDVTLTFRHAYYVGMTEATAASAVQSEAQALASLKRAACFHGDIPASMALIGKAVPTTSNQSMGYSLVIQPDSLGFASIGDSEHRVALDYGACVFDAAGIAIQFMHHSTITELTRDQYEKAMADGFANRIDLPRRSDASLVRLVVRDRSTGNLGIMEVGAGADGQVLNKGTARDNESFKIVDGRAMVVTHAIGSFGSILPQSPSLCGDVYELKPGTPRIVTNFGEQDAVGSLYTPTLEVHQQKETGGLPGVTSNEEWFSIDYYGEFWTSIAGDYHFRLLSDDGANLYIDDRLVIDQDGIHPPIQGERSVFLDAGRHTIHLPYFQGPGVVSLILEMKIPGKGMEVFDMRKLGPKADRR